MSADSLIVAADAIRLFFLNAYLQNSLHIPSESVCSVLSK